MDRSVFRHSTFWIVLAAVAAGMLGLWLGQRSSSAEPVFQGKVLLYPQARPLAPFELEHADGSPFGPSQLAGRTSVLFFGFTHCPDICPTTLALLAAVEKQLATRLPAARRPQLVFISVDPQRDRGAQLKTYVDYFNPALQAVTGTPAAVKAFTEQLGVQYFLQPADAAGSYSVDHSSDLYLIGPDGRRLGLIRPPFTTAALAADLETLLQ